MPHLPPPVDFGLPFPSWRAGQEHAIVYALDSSRRFVGLTQGTGAGKSLIYMGVGKLSGGRVMVLTATKALQQQLYGDYRGDGTTLVQGQSMYRCRAVDPGGELYRDYGGDGDRIVMVDHGPCHLGVKCSLKEIGCGYFDAIRAACHARVVLANYAWWLAIRHRPGFVFPTPDLLVLDEAHDAPDQLAASLGADVTTRDVRDILDQKLGLSTERSAEVWVRWAITHSDRLANRLESMSARTRADAIRKRRAQWLMRSLERIALIQPPLLLTSDTEQGIRFDLVWAAPYADEHLFRGVKKVLLTSATLTRHTTDLLGIAPDDLDLYETGDGFPVDRRPVYVVPTVRVDHRMSLESERLWLLRIDQILRARPDRKGIIHTVSYRRRDTIMARSECRDRLMTHGRADTADQIALFKRSPPGTVLVSPSVTTGYDFPGLECEFQIICKVPFPDMRDPVIRARQLVDSEYANHVALQTLVQAVGRGMRSADDRCEVLIIDDHARWMLNKAHSHLTPGWFRRAVKWTETVPPPPPKLTGNLSHV